MFYEGLKRLQLVHQKDEHAQAKTWHHASQTASVMQACRGASQQTTGEASGKTCVNTFVLVSK